MEKKHLKQLVDALYEAIKEKRAKVTRKKYLIKNQKALTQQR